MSSKNIFYFVVIILLMLRFGYIKILLIFQSPFYLIEKFDIFLVLF